MADQCSQDAFEQVWAAFHKTRGDIVKVPRGPLLTHHFRRVDPDTGSLMGALADVGATRARELIGAAGQPVD